ncbi:class I SAM-dependent DNA methyltransferase [Weissella confusa]|uniref:Class I SAM-dependent methyltransferase n=1 Tax=Weissella confusa TaxID=1583 RepID=A0A4Z0RKW4_WEICO|nr:class I SAM-dependent methyltransferase [Weissella confusa]MBJ7616148.1 class I SAM-dependent methyltransferase [Weissella confusa]MBJ7626849.1 class I SAM-dependent methyltransferase [Weissella confusa]MBJ7633433.1 class I SAM-dependent methyltransferase [Weissella confusa]MBJ7639854.1 class I SAM-dependent methyltransferase [Weissella confusa]MBJ7646231.1 class I SAM-dependent methyltransferase [Weissella confusa]
MNYQTFAKLYDDLFDEAAYADWFQYATKFIKNKDGKLLELAGGAGRLAIQLKQAGYDDISVLDLSTEMLALAAQHAQEAELDLPLIEGDMREWSDFDERFATITSFADSFNYLANEDEILMAFKQVAEHLEDGGQFLFDVISPWQTDVYYPGYMYNWHDDETAFMWSSYGVEEQPHTVEHELTFFVYNEDIDGFQQLQEVHTERTYSLDTYKRLLTEAGFTNIEVTADFGRAEVTDESPRWFFNATKA